MKNWIDRHRGVGKFPNPKNPEHLKIVTALLIGLKVSQLPLYQRYWTVGVLRLKQDKQSCWLIRH